LADRGSAIPFARRAPGYIDFDRAGNAMTADDVKAAIWHDAMARKFPEASRYPCFPVMRDPPELEGPE